MKRGVAVGMALLTAVAAALLLWDLTPQAHDFQPTDAEGAAGDAAPSRQRRAQDSAKADADDGVDTDEEPPPVVEEKPLEESVTWDESLSLTVVDAAGGSPVAGADVRILVRWKPEEFRTGTTDEAGRVEIPICNRWPVVWVRAQGFALFTRDSRTGLADTLEVRLTRGHFVTGQVVHDGTGAPVEGAEVFVWDAVTEKDVDIDPLRYRNRDGDGLVTDTDGRFELAGVLPGHTLTLVTRAPGLGITRRQIAPDAGVRELIIRLGAGGVLEGKATLDGAAAAPGVLVYAVPYGDDIALRNPDSTWHVGRTARVAPYARTDARGSYRIEGLPVPARYVAVATSEESAQGASEPAQLETARQEVRRDVNLVTPAWPTVRVRSPSGEEVPLEYCDLVQRDGSEIDDPFFSGSRSYTRGSDEWSLHTRPPGKWLVVAIPWGRWQTARLPVDLAPGERRTFDVVMHPGVSLSGSVYDDAGRPVPDANVRFDENCFARWATTDAQGAFELEGLPEGRIAITVAYGGKWVLPRTVEVQLPEDDGTRIVVTRRPEIVGRIDSSDEERARFTAFIRTENQEFRVNPDFSDHGHFRLPGPATEGPFDLYLRFFEDGAPAVFRNLTTTKSRPLDLGTIVPQPGLTAAGRVLDRAGAPVPGAVVLYDGPAGTHSVKTDDEGRFSFAGLPDEPAEVQVRAPGCVGLRVTLTPGTDEEIRCLPGLRVSGVLQGTDADDVAGLALRLVRRDDPQAVPLDLRTDSLGRFETRAIAPGEYDVYTRTPGKRFDQGNSIREFSKTLEHLGRVTVTGSSTNAVVLRLPAR